MSLFVIGDLHLHFQSVLKAPGQLHERVWKNHEEKFRKNCGKLVAEDDTLVLVGDHSWGKNLSECEQDLQYICDLPGRKILTRGNHDMFWDAKKTGQLNQLYQPRLVQLIQLSGLLRIPEHVVVAPCQDLPARQVADILQILFAFRKILAPAVVSHQDEGVILRHQLSAVLPELLFMIFPYALVQLPGRLQHRLKVQVQIPDYKQTHVSLTCPANSSMILAVIPQITRLSHS